MNADKTLTAAFSIIQRTLTVGSTGMGAVALNPPGGVYDDGTVVTLSAVADQAWMFDGWTGDVADPQSPVTTTTMNTDKTLTARFVQNRAPEKPKALSPSNEARFDAGPVTLKASAFSDPDGDAHLTTHWRVRRADSVYGRSDYPGSFDQAVSAGDLTTHTLQGLAVGLKYVWKVGYEDDGSGEISWSGEYAFKIGPSEGDGLPPIPAGTELADFRMVSIIQWPDDAECTNAFGIIYDPEDFRIGAYDPLFSGGDYRECGSGLVIEPGRAYWFLSRAGIRPVVKGLFVSQNHDAEVGLRYNAGNGNGWNMIASPNGMGYLWDQVEVVAYDADGNVVFGPTPVSALPDPNDFIELSLWRWESGDYFPDTLILDAYDGYWVRTKKANVYLRFPVSAQVRLSNPRTLFAFILKRGQRLAGQWVPEPQKALADTGDTPPPPMADFSIGYRSENTEAGGSVGCFIRTASNLSGGETHGTTGAPFPGDILFRGLIGLAVVLMGAVLCLMGRSHRIRKRH